MISCLSGGSLVANTASYYYSKMNRMGSILQADRVMTRIGYSIQEAARGTGILTTVSNTADVEVRPEMATPTDNYYAVRETSGGVTVNTLYRSPAHTTTKQAIKSWPSTWHVAQLAYQGRYVVWLAATVDSAEVGTYDTLTGQVKTLYTPALGIIYEIAADSQWIYFTEAATAGRDLYRIPLTGGTPELRVGNITRYQVDLTLKVTANYLYWLDASGMVMYQTK
jgi:hypothetical protein